MNSKFKKILILGSGGLRIGQAGEFDYSGSQAIKAFKEEGIRTVLVNSNIATVQTDGDRADTVYFQPLNFDTVKMIIEKEKPDAIALSFGGQTALNLGLALEAEGILKRHRVAVLGTPLSTVRITEDRDLFKKALGEIDVKTARSFAVSTVAEAVTSAKKLGYPVMMRSGYSLGGLGSGRMDDEKQLKERAHEALQGAPQILIEEYLGGWKEIEYEVVRDRDGNTITVCNMENFDPMGIHTGESIVVAPSQTLTNTEYHALREIAIRTINHLGIVGECNIQYAMRQQTHRGERSRTTQLEYRVIEVNARLSRSSALASKATGYPLAYVAAKLALGARLHELKNSVTKKTSAFFEPALDYIAVKIPRWDLQKMKASDHRIGSEMKSVGEVMALGRSFPEALQKAMRMVNQYKVLSIKNYEEEIKNPTDRRLWVLLEAFKKGMSVEKAHQLSQITPWFLEHIKAIVDLEVQIKRKPLDAELITSAKRMGFSDKQVALLQNKTEEEVRKLRLKHRITPIIKQIDTLAGEFDAQTNYLYTTYHGAVNDVDPLRLSFSQNRPSLPAGKADYSLAPSRSEKFLRKSESSTPVIVLGSGPYCIGSSVEFDWCAVNAVKALRKHGKQTIVINSNPETVSTDFDTSDRLYFEELTLERVRDIADFESGIWLDHSPFANTASFSAENTPATRRQSRLRKRLLKDSDQVMPSIIVSVGGQIANNLALSLSKGGYALLGTSATSIDKAEDRNKFSAMLTRLGIDQPAWVQARTLGEAKAFAKKVGYPLLIRPSYVLSGGAMNIVSDDIALKTYLTAATMLSPEHPVVISKFITGAKEFEIDAVARDGKIVIFAISEHIENAGIHSGDATVVLPPQRLYLETVRRAKRIAKQIAAELAITGPFNIQFLARDNAIKVIECNVRASRSFPFVSKVIGHNFIEIATEAMLAPRSLGEVGLATLNFRTLDLDYVAVKSPQFSYNRLKGADPVAGVEMASTGEVACFGADLNEAFYRSWLATEQSVKGKRILLSIADDAKDRLLESIPKLVASGYELIATKGTHEYLKANGVASQLVNRLGEAEPTIATAIKDRLIDLVINVPTSGPADHDAYLIRRLAIDHHIPLMTNAETARVLLRCLAEVDLEKLEPKSWQEIVG